jgi:hypothetical protein
LEKIFKQSVDETTDTTQRAIANVIDGAVKPNGPSPSYPVTSKVLDKTNSGSSTTLAHDSLKFLFQSNLYDTFYYILFIAKFIREVFVYM